MIDRIYIICTNEYNAEKVLEAIENTIPNIKWDTGEKPTEWDGWRASYIDFIVFSLDRCFWDSKNFCISYCCDSKFFYKTYEEDLKYRDTIIYIYIK